MPQLTFKNLYDRLLEHYTNPLTAQTTEAKELINDGYQLFYNSYPWTFAQKASTVTMATGASGVYALPTDCSGLLTDPVISTDLRVGRLERKTVEWILDRNYRNDSGTGIPRYYAVRAKDHSGTTGTRYEMIVSPWPDVSYTAVVNYRPELALLSTDGEYPMGGGAHSLTILQAALMLYEERKGETGGVQRMLFYGNPQQGHEGYLARSIRIDSENTSGILGCTPDPTESPLRHPLGPYPMGTYTDA